MITHHSSMARWVKTYNDHLITLVCQIHRLKMLLIKFSTQQHSYYFLLRQWQKREERVEGSFDVTMSKWEKMEGSHLLICFFKKPPLVLNPWRQSIFIFFSFSCATSIVFVCCTWLPPWMKALSLQLIQRTNARQLKRGEWEACYKGLWHWRVFETYRPHISNGANYPPLSAFWWSLMHVDSG